MTRLTYRSMLIALIGIGISALVMAQGPAQAPGRRLAFLVGVEVYEKNSFKSLDWAEDDVVEMERELRRLGFDKIVTLTSSKEGELHADKEHIEAQLKEFLKSVRKNDIVLVMLSGHGQQLTLKSASGKEREEAFFCPADAVVNEAETMVSINQLVEKELTKHSAKNLVLIDACRDAVIVDNDRGVKGVEGKEGLLSPPKGTAVLFSCSEGQRSLEFAALVHGVFAYSVLQALQSFDGQAGGAITWAFLVDKVLNGVAERNVEQEPVQISGSMPLVVLANSRVPATTKPLALRNTMDRTKPTTPSIGMEGTKAGEQRSDNGLNLKLRWCAAGRFTMGSPESEPERGKDEAQVAVTLTKGFWLGEFEVTQSQWKTVMGTSIEQQRDKKDSTNKLYGEGPDHPIYYVNHSEATEFCRRLTETERRAGRLAAGWEYRLPTEAQWEYACRAGTTTATSFGNSLSSLQANFNGGNPYNGAAKGPDLGKTSVVGEYPANAWGLRDMHGNVWEWCRDGYTEALKEGQDPEGPESASSRVSRGGSGISGGRGCRSAIRGRGDPANRYIYLGFRVARVPSGS